MNSSAVRSSHHTLHSLQMTTERQCGLTSLLPMSCRGRAEAFARRLHSRLSTLGSPGSEDDAEQSESSWLSARPALPITVTNHQPRNLSDSDVYYDFDIDMDGPFSPVEEATEKEFSRLIADEDVKDKITSGHAGGCHCVMASRDTESGYTCTSPVSESSTTDSSSSDGPYYDPDSDIEKKVHSHSYEKFAELQKINVAQLMHNGFHSTSQLSSKLSPNLIHSSTYNFTSDIDLKYDSSESSLPPSQASEDITTVPSLTPNSRESQSSWTIAEDDTTNSLRDDESSFCSAVQSDFEEPFTNGTSQPEMISLSNGSCPTQDEDHVTNVQSIKCSTNTEALTNGTTLHLDIVPVVNGLSTKIENTIETKGSFNGTSEAIEPETEEINSKTEVLTNGYVDDTLCSTLDKSLQISAEITSHKPINVETHIDSLTVISNGETIIKITENGSIDNTSNSSNTNSDEEEFPQRVRRCSSLRTGKTPPGTPGRKKIVRFADVFGLDLADVRTFMDDIPKIPKSAYEDLVNADLRTINDYSSFSKNKADRCLVPLFQQPGGQPSFLDRVRDRQVCLENAIVEDPVSLAISGNVRVRNLDFHKSVYIRYTTDSWRTFAEVQGSYVLNSCDGFSDKFTFIFYSNALSVGQRLEFAVRFHCKGCQYWDNNLGVNYCFQCLPATTTSYAPITRSSPDNLWMPSFY